MFRKRDFARSLRGKALTPSLRKAYIKRTVEKHSISLRKACELFCLSRRAYYYQSQASHDGELKKALLQLAQRYPRYGYWSLDFMSDSLRSGKRFRTLNIIDDFNREALMIEIDTSLPAARVIRVLEQLKEIRGLPRYIRVDNGSELTSHLLKEWTESNDIQLLFIQPGKPTQNAYIERFNGSYRREVLNAYEFTSLAEVQQITERWIQEYNDERPHASLNYLTPNQYLQNYYVENSLS